MQIDDFVDSFARWWGYVYEDYQVLQYRLQSRLGRERNPDLWSHRAKSDFLETPARAKSHPILELMKRRAAWNLFDWLGLDRIPNVYWTLFSETRSPTVALSRFVSLLKMDFEALRAQDNAAILAFAETVTLFCQFESDRNSLSPDMLFRLDHLAASNQGERLTELRRTLVMLNECVELFQLCPASWRFDGYRSAVVKARSLRNAASRTSPERACGALADVLVWAEIALSAQLLSERISRLEITDSGSPDDPSQESSHPLLRSLNGLKWVDVDSAIERVLRVRGALSDPVDTVKLGTDFDVLKYFNASDILGLAYTPRHPRLAILQAFNKRMADAQPYVGSRDYATKALHYRLARRHRAFLMALPA